MREHPNGFHVAFVGNPNCGKTTLFNAITGARLKVANWPGVTVEKKEGTVEFEDEKLILIDTPGIYSLSTYTIEEKVTRNCILDDDIEVIVNVVDASSLERNLYLTLQLLELGKPIVMALNMMDVVEERGMEIDMHRLPEMLCDIPIVPVSAIKKRGLDILLHAIIHHKEAVTLGEVFSYSDALEDKIKKLEVIMAAKYPNHSSARWHAIKLLEDDEEVSEEHPVDVSRIVDKSYSRQIIQAKYSYIDDIIKECLFNKSAKEAGTDRIDAILTHPVFGVPCFLIIMALVFLLTFTLGDWIKGFLEIFLEWLQQTVSVLFDSAHVAVWLKGLVVDGIIAGVGGILTFLPNIIILFIALAVLEDSGYMARVAYVMDGIMGKLGLSGKAFLPMILGFGCTVPAIMATRALETPKDRRRTMLITPFMSCSARLPIYVLFSGLFFGKWAAVVSFSMYVLGILVALATAFIANLFDKKKNKNNLLIELPEYKRPNLRSIRIYVWNKVKDYLTKAGTTIFIASIIVWFALNIGPRGFVGEPADSFAAIVAKVIAPALKPCGLNMWEVVVALFAGVSAKEVVVTSFTVLFSNAVNGASLYDSIKSVYPTFTAANALALMVFCLLYTPCLATIATIKKESESIKFTLLSMLFQIGVAFAMSTLIFNIARLFVG
ncbi:ferrous iron transport protein B [Lachnospiraceae bacterium G41]|nr:ferrous iron transport protein B [Lachnospiraceae bacterium G41]